MTEELIQGLRKLRKGALLDIVALFLAISAIFMLFVSIGPTLISLGNFTRANFSIPPEKFIKYGNLSILGVAIAMLILAFMLFIGAFVLWFISTGHLKRHNSSLGIGRIGMVLQVIAILVILFSFVPLLLSMPSVPATRSPASLVGAMGTFLLCIILALILALVGAVLFGIMLLRLSDEEKVDQGFRTAGILYIVAIVLSFIPFISMVAGIISIVSIILIYTSAGKSLENLKTAEQSYNKSTP